MTNLNVKLSSIRIAKYQILVEQFKRGIFDFITDDQNGVRHKKQYEALQVLTDKKTREFLYGGAAGGAKSWTGATWLLLSSLAYPGTKWFIGRESLKRLRDSTLLTFYKVCKEYDVPKEIYRYNGQDNYLQFENGSRIDMLDLRYMPSDPLYERYGSVEYTGGWLEEGGEVNFGSFDTLKTRVGRHLNKKFGLTPKIFVTCNPKKNWMYSYFYKPAVAKLLSIKQKFLQAFVQDNPFIEPDYLEQLQSTTDKSKRERLLKGNWEYDDNPYKLAIYDKILEIFTNTHITKNRERYITADVARFGSDLAVVGVWEDWDLVEVHEFAISKTTEIQSCIQTMQIKHDIASSNVLVDSDGVGGGVVDNINAIGFVNNASPFKEEITDGRKDKPHYRNMQTQLLVYLAEEIINKNKILISAELSEDQKEKIKEDLDTIERVPDTTSVTLVDKKHIKEEIGRSPDYRDLIFMRAYFDFSKPIRNNLEQIASIL